MNMPTRISTQSQCLHRDYLKTFGKKMEWVNETPYQKIQGQPAAFMISDHPQFLRKNKSDNRLLGGNKRF